MKVYDPKKIEPKWQKTWRENETYTVNLDSDKPKYFGFAMFNYPSGGGIHVGHVKNYTLPDILLRFKRQQGFEAYAPIGWDSFGLPAENYAIKTGKSPRYAVDTAIENFQKQYQAMGWGVDWSKEIDSSESIYYQWTQWIFLQLFNHDLAYQKESMQWWCEQCQTVLADEQVLSGKCWRHDDVSDALVTKKSLKQWFFKITHYADQMLEATDGLNWTPWVKKAQKNWIGRSEGTNIRFHLSGIGAEKESLEVFTTACETIYGATFMVLAPEHTIVKSFAKNASNHSDISNYVEQTLSKSELDRTKAKTKTGVPIEGLFAVNPANGEKLPVWIADYVLPGYGSGAVMAVPGQDERDHEFASKYDLPIVYTTTKDCFVNYAKDIKPNLASYTMANSDEFNDLSLGEARQKIIDKLVDADKANTTTQYKIRDWLISRQRYWGAPIPIIHCDACGVVPVPEDQLPLELPETDDYKSSGDGQSPLAKVDDWVNISCPKCSADAKRETDTMDGYVCSSWYIFRYLDPTNNEKPWDTKRSDKWMPVDFYNGGDHATAHLLYVRFFTRFFHELGLTKDPEPIKRMYMHAKILAPDGTAFSKSKGNGVDPLDIIAAGYGADALRLYVMFIAPPDVESPWNTGGVPSCLKFLKRVWTITQAFIESKDEQGDVSEPLAKAIHSAIKKVTIDIERIKFNTAIAAMMTCVNDMYAVKESEGFKDKAGWQFALESLIQLLAPFAPHMAEELWHDLGHTDTVHIDHWPKYDEACLVEDEMVIAVQVNGKLRGEIAINADAPKNEILKYAKEEVAKFLIDKEIRKEIYVPGKIVNIVV